MTGAWSGIETPRLRLRRFTDGDLEAFVAYRSLPATTQFLERATFTAEDGRALLAEMQDREPGQPGTWFQFAVERRSVPGLIGDVGLRTDWAWPRVMEVGYTFDPAARGQGFATEAVRGVLSLAFTELGAHRVSGNCDARNAASAAVMERLGMRREAHHLEDYWAKGAWTSSLVYAVLAREWPSARSPA